MQLRFKRDGWSSQRVRVHLAHGPVLGRIDLSTWRTGAEITLPSGTCTVRKDRDGALVLYRNGLPEAQAVQPSVFKALYDVEWPDGKGVLRQRSVWGGSYVLEADGQEVAMIKRSGWTGRVEGRFPPEWPVERALFVGTVALLAWAAQDGAR